MFPNKLEIGDSETMTDIICLGVGLVAQVLDPEHAEFIKDACNAHDRLVAEIASLRALINAQAIDLADALVKIEGMVEGAAIDARVQRGLVDALKGVIRVADRQTDEFDAARAALTAAGATA